MPSSLLHSPSLRTGSTLLLGVGFAGQGLAQSAQSDSLNAVIAGDQHDTLCLRAALGIRDFIFKGMARKSTAGLPFYEIRIGAHRTGSGGDRGGAKRLQCDIWGRYGEHRRSHGKQRQSVTGEHE